MAAKDYQYRIYGQATSVYFSSLNNAGTAVWAGGFGAGESQISKDGGAFANTTNLPTYIGNGVYNIVLTATEMQAEFINLSFIDSGPGNIPDWVQIDTKLKVGLVEIDSTSFPSANIALEIHSGTDAVAVEISADAGNAVGLSIIGSGTGNALLCTGGATAAGAAFVGGATSGEGLKAIGSAGNSGGAVITGSGTAAGLAIVGGATGIGMAVDAGASGAVGLQIRSIAGNNDAVSIVGSGTGVGLGVVGGASGNGARIYGGATTGVGMDIRAQAGNNNGISLTGAGTGSGLLGTGGSSNGPGITGSGLGAGTGFYGTSVSSHPTNFFSEFIEDITGVPTPGSTTLRQAIAALIARFYYLVTQTSTQQKQYASDSATLRGTSTVSDDGVTQTKGKAS